MASKLMSNTANQYEKHDVDTDETHGLCTLQVHHRQPPTQGNIFFWERFLHVRSIKVLLVENDDSTRHVVTALLRNCNYEMLDAANGLQAWMILEDLKNHVDIVLTEVVMPFLSGVALLNKIMSHKTRKNIPVIMMSSHDSMGLVFKCLSKGAVDFLVKPIRKNELKNLWQHVWRRCHTSSGSGSESGTQTQISVKSKGSEKSVHSSSDDCENDWSNGPNTGDGSNDGSGTQSSRTRQAMEVDTCQAVSPTDQNPDSPESTCAPVIQSTGENLVQISLGREALHQKQLENVEKDSEEPVVKPINSASGSSDSTREVANRINTSHYENDDCNEMSFELGLKRQRGVRNAGFVQEDRYVLRRSEQSAFSRYNTPANAFKAPNDITGSSGIIENYIVAAKKESVGNIVDQCSKGVSTTIDMISTTNKLSKDKSEATSAGFMSVKNDFKYCQQQANVLPDGMQFTDSCSVFGSKQDSQIRHSHPRCNGSFLTKLSVNASLANAFIGPIDGDPRDFSINKSISGSKHGSNGPDVSNPATNTVGNNAESGVDQAVEKGSGGASGGGRENRVDESKLTLREAVLIKYRQKRNERCFKKKVRYQNRKKLSDQRPRVKGQFVKQTGTENSNRSGDE